ncbi:maleylpyruvate isomerase family mycothiol-dependent enzyme [Nocardioides sp. JQ2195]|uniref:maleylpyruvate isomerase family mycothiol-dependent enzyme n=1 Tax=Nocardioides sp. JQ2195 TaxID=2592334 RepID=UPI00143E5AA6|nr:maleylpyruvate isomerase family mycothiol-dependent enzyme [Nocardioides sp. JQ2195]QIX27549.1 maleylpyruvate isomerase family mycothiol-dependent enzyme [Nocardioides sp. JQ2195]
MTRLPDDAYLDHLRSESARFRDVLAATDPTDRVPSCPDWDAADLLWHLTEVQHFWSRIVADRPTGPDAFEEPPRPTTYADLLTAFDDASAGLVEALRVADPKEQAWTWAPEQTVGFILRRQAHEALIHRLDAEQAAGTVTDLDARLAADGVEEVLAVMFGGTPGWGSFTGSETFVRVDCIDTDHHVWVELGRFTGTDPEDGVAHDEDDISVVTDPGREPDVVVSGTAADLDAWLWRRGDDGDLTVAGDRTAHDLFLTCVNHPID